MSKESKSSSHRIEVKTIERATLYDNHSIKSSKHRPVNKTQSCTVLKLKECSSSKPQVSQLNLKKKIDELHSSFFPTQDCSVDDASEATRKERKLQKNSLKIHSSCSQESKSSLTLPNTSFREGHSSVSQTQSKSNSKLQENDDRLKKKGKKAYSQEISLQGHYLYNFSNQNAKRSISVENVAEENHCKVSSFTLTKPQNVHRTKKFRKSHSFELFDQESLSGSSREGSCALGNTSDQSLLKENSMKVYCGDNSKLQNLHCHFKKQLDDLHSSFFPLQETCPASLDKKNQSNQASQLVVRKNTFESTADDISESTESAIQRRGASNEHSSAQTTRLTHTGVNSVCETKIAGTLFVDTTVRNHGSRCHENESLRRGNSFTSDFLTSPDCLQNINSELTEEANLNHLLNLAGSLAGNCEKTLSLAEVSLSTTTQSKKVTLPEEKILNVELIGNQDEHLVEGCEVLYSSIKKPRRLTHKKSCDAKLNLEPVQADLKYDTTIVSDREKDGCSSFSRTSSDFPVINPSFGVSSLAPKNSDSFPDAKNEHENLQQKNTDFSENMFKDPLPLSESKKKRVSFGVTALLAGLTQEFFSEPGPSPKQTTAKANCVDSRKNFVAKSDDSQNKILDSTSEPTVCEIPYLTVKKPENQTCNVRSIVKLFICDLLRMTPTSQRNYYMFHDLVVRRVDVFGVVAGARPVGDDRILYEVDDGSGRISCIYRTTKQRAALKKLNDFLRQTESDEMLTLTEATLNESCIEQNSERENALKHFRTCMENHLASKEEELCYQIGDTIHAVGVLYDYRDTVSFYIFDIRKVENLMEEADRYFQMAVLYSSTYPKIIKGFKT